VPAEARHDIGYIFSRAQWLRREDKATEAAELMLSVPNDPTQAVDLGQWWIERRFVSRTLLDLGIVSRAPPPYRAGPLGDIFLRPPSDAVGLKSA
jgi:hypothetical protein